MKGNTFLFKLVYSQGNTLCMLIYVEIYEKNEIVDRKDAFVLLFKNSQKWLVLQTNIFPLKTFPPTSLNRGTSQLRHLLNKIIQKYHCFLLVVRKMVQTKIFCPLLSPVKTLTQNPKILFLFFLFSPQVRFNTLSYILKLPITLLGATTLLLYQSVIAGQWHYTIFFHVLCEVQRDQIMTSHMPLVKLKVWWDHIFFKLRKPHVELMLYFEVQFYTNFFFKAQLNSCHPTEMAISELLQKEMKGLNFREAFHMPWSPLGLCFRQG